MSYRTIIDQLNRRRSVKHFDTTKKVSDSDMEIILESARLTPSSFGLQPWKIKVVSDQAIKDQLLPHAFDQPQITSCSHLLVLCGLHDISDQFIESFVQQSLDAGSDPERLSAYRTMLLSNIHHMKEHGTLTSYISNQAYIMLGTIVTVCAMMGIDTAPMGGFNSRQFDTILGLNKQGVHATVLCALGYRSTNDKRSHHSKFRFPLDDVILR